MRLTLNQRVSGSSPEGGISSFACASGCGPVQERAEVLIQLGFVLTSVLVCDAANEFGHRAVQCIRERGRMRSAHTGAHTRRGFRVGCWRPHVAAIQRESTDHRGWAEGGSRGRSLLVQIDMGVYPEREIGRQVLAQR